MLLKNKLTATHMSDTDTVASYLIKIIELRDQCAAIGMKVEDEELVPIALNGFSTPWESFVQYVFAREKPLLRIFGTTLSKRKQGER